MQTKNQLKSHRRNKSKSWLKIALAVVILLAAAGAVFYVVLNKKPALLPASKPEITAPEDKDDKDSVPVKGEKPELPPASGFQPTGRASLAAAAAGIPGITWTQDRRMSSAGGEAYTAYQNAHSVIAGPDGTAHMTWYEVDPASRFSYKIYYQKSQDNGKSWEGGDSPIETVVNFMGSLNMSVNPTLAVSGSNIFLVWSAQPAGAASSGDKKSKPTFKPTVNSQLYMKRSADNGASWQEVRQLTDLSGASFSQSLWAEGEHLYFVWMNMTEGAGGETNDVYFMHSGDLGRNWNPAIKLTEGGGGGQPTVVSKGDRALVFFMSMRDGNWEIYYKHSGDRGASWSDEIRFTDNPGISEVPAAAVDGDTVHLVWEDSSDGPTDFDYEIYYRRSDDMGLTWNDAVRLTNAPKYSLDPSISAQDGNVHIVFADRRDGQQVGRIEDKEMYYVYSVDNGKSWSQNIRLTNDPANSIFTTVWFWNRLAHIVWVDLKEGASAVYYKRGALGQ